MEWRTCKSGRLFRTETLLGLPAIQRRAAEIAANGELDFVNFRLAQLDETGSMVAGPHDLTLHAIRSWDGVGALPPPDTTGWSAERELHALRGRVLRKVRAPLLDAWRGGILEREQVADLLGAVEQAFCRFGPASRRVPSAR